MHRKPLDGWTRASHSSRCPVLLLSAKIRCCHLRNNTLSMWYEVFFDSVGALCTDCVKLAFLFLESWGLLTVCFFFLCVSFFVLPFTATLWQTTGGGPVSQSFLCLFSLKAGSWWKRPPSHPLARLRVGEVLATGPSVSRFKQNDRQNFSDTGKGTTIWFWGGLAFFWFCFVCLFFLRVQESGLEINYVTPKKYASRFSLFIIK